MIFIIQIIISKLNILKQKSKNKLQIKLLRNSKKKLIQKKKIIKINGLNMIVIQMKKKNKTMQKMNLYIRLQLLKNICLTNKIINSFKLNKIMKKNNRIKNKKYKKRK